MVAAHLYGIVNTCKMVNLIRKYQMILLINIIRKLAIKSEVHLKIIAITVTLVLKSCFLMYMLLMKKLSITITVFLLRWKNSLMEKLLLFYMKTKFL